MRNILSLFRDDRGAAAIEYGLGLALVAIASITAWGAIGSQASATADASPIATAIIRLA